VGGKGEKIRVRKKGRGTYLIWRPCRGEDEIAEEKGRESMALDRRRDEEKKATP